MGREVRASPRSYAGAEPVRKGSAALPELLDEIAGVVGRPAALAIAQLRGGARAHFPARCGDDHWLTVLIGREAADRLCRHFTVNHRGGVTLTVPLGPMGLMSMARMRARAMLAEGYSASETARAVGVTTRSIEYWIADDRKESARHSGPAEPAGAAVPTTVIDDPDFLVAVAEVAGFPVALQLAQSHVDRIISFPVAPPDDHWLVELFGRDTARKLCGHFGALNGEGAKFVVHSAGPFLFAVVQRRATALRAEGRSAAEVGAMFSVRPAQIEKWWAADRRRQAKHRADVEPADLLCEGEG